MKELTHLSLFAGIGGIDLAAEWAGFKSVGQVEWGEYQTKVLEKNFPDVPRWGDIAEFNKESFYERTGKETVNLITGGFPCQPHSLAGKRMASDDERDLWHEYKRIIRELTPDWIVAENVPGLLSSEDGRFFRGVLRDLAELGFNAGWSTYGAGDIGALHVRRRVFIYAYTGSKRRSPVDESWKAQRDEWAAQSAHRAETTPWIDERQLDLLLDGYGALTTGRGANSRNDDGLSLGMERLTALGNAVVPQQIYPILQAIATYETKVNI